MQDEPVLPNIPVLCLQRRNVMSLRMMSLLPVLSHSWTSNLIPFHVRESSLFKDAKFGSSSERTVGSTLIKGSRKPLTAWDKMIRWKAQENAVMTNRSGPIRNGGHHENLPGEQREQFKAWTEKSRTQRSIERIEERVTQNPPLIVASGRPYSRTIAVIVVAVVHGRLSTTRRTITTMTSSTIPHRIV